MSEDFEVGYGKPPRHTQFQKGTSGNAKGRPRGAKNLKTDLVEELQEQVLIREGGKGKAVSKQRAMIKSLMARAVKGDTRAANLLLTMFLKLVPDEVDDKETNNLTETDLAILERFKKDAMKSPVAPETSDDQ
jgi:hypothetical protein